MLFMKQHKKHIERIIMHNGFITNIFLFTNSWDQLQLQSVQLKSQLHKIYNIKKYEKILII